MGNSKFNSTQFRFECAAGCSKNIYNFQTGLNIGDEEEQESMLKNDEEMEEAKRKRIELMKHLKYHDKRFKNCPVGC